MSAVAIYLSALLVFVTITGVLLGFARIRDTGGFATWVVARARRHEARTGQTNGYSVTSLEIARAKGWRMLIFGLVWDAMLIVAIVLTW